MRSVKQFKPVACNTLSIHTQNLLTIFPLACAHMTEAIKFDFPSIKVLF